jgi:hypothetical protein
MGGGCICCADEQSLGDAVTTLAGNGRVRALVVETSGLADPAATIALLHYVLGRHALEPYRGTEAPKPVGVFIGPRINADRILRRLDRVFAPRRQGSRRKSNPPDGND